MAGKSTKQYSPSSASGRWLVLALGLTFVVGAGVVYGRYSQRWGPPPDLKAAAERLNSFPAQIGRWNLVEDRTIDKPTLDMLECAGYVSRRYANGDTGEVIDMFIVVGPPGPISVHTPEICFSSRNYEKRSKRQPWAATDQQGRDNSFWWVGFQSNNVMADRIVVYFAWSPGDTWTAAVSPRYGFAALPKLYKIQLAGLLPPEESQSDDDPCRSFLKSLLESGWTLNTSNASS